MADEKTEQAGGDDGFTHESASVSFTPPPIDTTVGAGSEPVLEVVAEAAAGVSDGEPPADEQEGPEPPVADPSQESASLASAPAAKLAKKKGPTLTERTSKLQKDVDTLTYQKHQTQREMDEAASKLATMRAELADLEAKRTPLAARPKAVDQPADTIGPMPEHPKYRDFATDEEYEAAVATWRTDTATWQAARETALEQRITGGIDSRLTAAQAEAAARRSEAALSTRLTAAQEKHPADWREKTATLKGLRSTWYDPAAHGVGSTTPFLSDLAQHHESEGAELLYWLGSDPSRAQVLADLRPTRPLRDALALAPSLLPLLEYFATPEGVQAFEGLKGMHPIRMDYALGALSARLTAASRGSAPAAHVMTQAVPPAKPPVGTPGARGAGAPAATQTFDDWYEAENRRELAERKRLAGISA